MDLAAAILKKREKELNKPKKSADKKVIKKPKKATIADFKGSVAKASKPVFKSVSKLKPTPTSIVAKVPSAPKKVIKKAAKKKVTFEDFAGVKAKAYKGTPNKQIHNGMKIAGYGIGGANTMPVYENDDFLTQLGKQAVNTVVGVPKTALGIIGLIGEGLRQLPIQSRNLMEGKGFKEYKGPTTARDMLGSDWGREYDTFVRKNPALDNVVGGFLDVALDPINLLGLGEASAVSKGLTTAKQVEKGISAGMKVVSKQAQKQAQNIAKGITTKAKSGLKLTESEKNIVKNNPKTFAEIQVSKVDQDAQKVFNATQDVKKPRTPAQEAFLKNRELNRASLETTAPGIKTKEGLLKVEKTARENMTDGIDVLELKDVRSTDRYLNDPYRLISKVEGKGQQGKIKKLLLDPLDAGKKARVEMEKEITSELWNNVVKKFGIKKGSKESAAIQWYGEGKKIQGVEKVLEPQTGKMVKNAKLVDYTLADLKRDFPNKWKDIVESDKFFRKTYDDTILKMNESRALIYGNVKKKIKQVEEQIQDIANKLDEKTAERHGLEQGRTYSTVKEIDLDRQARNLESKIAKNKLLLKDVNINDATKPIIENKIKSFEKQLLLKKAELKKANMYGQPSSKKVADIDRQIARLESLKEAKEELLKSETLWRGKFIPKRKDYYRHFREISDNFEALKNIFDTPAQISPELAGTSDFTQPFSKFLGLAQRRGKGYYKADAVGGLLDYTRAASYATHIDPNIVKIRNFAMDLAKETAESKHLNNTIEYLREFADNLAGKTGAIDRVMQKFVGRKVMKVLVWGNKRVKANTVVGNAASSLSQIANIPQGIAKIKNPIHLTQGAADTLKGFIVKNKAMGNSGFIMERYGDRLYRKFDTKWIDQPKRFASWMLEVGDEIGTKFIWNAAYRNNVAKGVKNAVKEADDITRSLVAGRGVGEVPLAQQQKVFQLVAPFQLEVANLWHVMKDFVKVKDFGGLATLFIANYMFNRGMEKVRGSGVVFDPIRAIEQSLSDDDTNLFEKLANYITKGETPHAADTTTLQKGGRIAGEVLSNLPLGQTLASWYPEYGGEMLGKKLPTRKDLFGREDPTRYGTSTILLKAFQKPEYALLPPFGGIQIEKTQKGIEALLNKGVEKDGKLKYPVKQDASNIIKGTLFGVGGLSETKDYYNNDRRPFTEKQTAEFNDLVAKGFNPDKLYNYMMLERKLKSLETKYNKAKTKDEVQKIIEEYKRVSGQFAILGKNLK